MPRSCGFNANTAQFMGRDRATRSRKPDSGHADTISITLRVRRAGPVTSSHTVGR